MDSRRRVQFSTFHLLRQLGSFFFSIFYYCSFFVLFSLQQVEHTRHGASHNPHFAHSLLFSLGHATFHSKLCLCFKVSSVGSHHLLYFVLSSHFILFHHLFHFALSFHFFVFCRCTSSYLVVTFLCFMRFFSLVQMFSSSFGFIIATFLCYFFPSVI